MNECLLFGAEEARTVVPMTREHVTIEQASVRTPDAFPDAFLLS